MITLRIVNSTRGSVVATHASVAQTPNQRRVGLLYTKEFKPGQGLLIPDCRRIHTHGMMFPIDVIFFDSDTYEVLSLCDLMPGTRMQYDPNLKDQRIACLELPFGTVIASGTGIGDVLALMSSTHCSKEELKEAMRSL